MPASPASPAAQMSYQVSKTTPLLFLSLLQSVLLAKIFRLVIRYSNKFDIDFFTNRYIVEHLNADTDMSQYQLISLIYAVVELTHNGSFLL